MSAGNIESLLARLYTDARFRETFLSDPAAAARSHGLDETEVEALCNIDREGLEFAARSYAQKREAHGRSGRRRSLFAKFVDRLRTRRD
jgi:putative modified peptide